MTTRLPTRVARRTGRVSGLLTVTNTPPGYGLSSGSFDVTSNRRAVWPKGASAGSAEIATTCAEPGPMVNGAGGDQESQGVATSNASDVTFNGAFPSLKMVNVPLWPRLSMARPTLIRGLVIAALASVILSPVLISRARTSAGVRNRPSTERAADCNAATAPAA